MSEEDLGLLISTVSDVRAWARERGLPVGARGRIAGGLIEAYEAATGTIVIKQAGKGILA